MGVSFNGYDKKILTFKKGISVTIGSPVKISGNNTVVDCSDEDNFCGIAISIKNDYVGVQMRGYVSSTYSGTTTPTVGYSKICADGSSAFKPDSTNGKNVLIVEVNSTDKTLGFIF